MKKLLQAAAIALTLGSTGLPLQAGAQPASVPGVESQTPPDNDAIIAKVREAQEQLRRGEPVYFQLLFGAPASYRETMITPRDAFLALSLDDPTNFRNKSTGNRLWQPFQFEINGQRSLVWQVDVVLGFYDNVERIEIFARPPHPF